ncbi:MAG: hypothetical protein Q4D62_00890 [Planctomycetia bacterium]|nr:hypothetical protein [Planctomycetia bacterium]
MQKPNISFDPYRIWLGISPAEQPPNHYRLLGIPLFETDPQVISNAADRQMAHVRTFQSGQYSEQSQKILNELSAARVILLDAAKRTAYDQQLRTTLMTAAMPMPTMAPTVPVAPLSVPPAMAPTPAGTPGMVPPMPSSGMVPPISTPAAPNPMVGMAPPVATNSPTRTVIRKKKTDQTFTYAILALLLLGGLGGFLLMGKSTPKEKMAEKAPFQEEMEEYESDLPDLSLSDAMSTALEEENASAEALSAKKKEEKPEDSQESADIFDQMNENFEEEDLEEENKAEAKKNRKKGKKSKKDQTKTADSEKKNDSSKDAEKKEEESQKEAKPTEPKITPEEIVALGKGVTLRQEPNKAKMLAFYEADAKTASVIEEGLQWLGRRQLQDGSWNFNHTLLRPNRPRPNSSRCENVGTMESCPNAATALALMAYLGDGKSLKDRDYRKEIMNGITYLLRKARPVSEQILRTPQDFQLALAREASLVEGEHADFRSHAWGTVAVCEFFAMTKETPYRVAAQALVAHVEHQQNEDGGWPERERELNVNNMLVPKKESHRSSTIATVWNLMALRAAKDAGLEVSRRTLDNAIKYLTRKMEGLERDYKNHPQKQILATDVQEYTNLFLGLELLNEPPERPLVKLILEKTVKKPIPGDMRYSFMTTLLARDVQGEIWENWNELMKKEYLQTQTVEKEERGSWFYPVGDESRFEGGRFYCTAMTLLILESYYRYSPLRPLDEKDPEVNLGERDGAEVAEKKETEISTGKTDAEKYAEELEEAEPLFPDGL